MSDSEISGATSTSENVPSPTPATTLTVGSSPTDLPSPASVQSGGTPTAGASPNVDTASSAVLSSASTSSRQPTSNPTTQATSTPDSKWYSTETLSDGSVASYFDFSTSGNWTFSGTSSYFWYRPSVTPMPDINPDPTYLKPIIPRPTDTGGAFNSTVAITLNTTSPMIDLDPEDGCGPFKIDVNTGFRTYDTICAGEYPIHFVGVGYSINGSAELPGGAYYGVPYPVQDLLYSLKLVDKDITGDALQQVNVSNGSSNLGEMKGLNLSAYQIDLSVNPSSKVTLRNVTFHIPVKTQAENFGAMQSQAKTIMAAQGNDVSPFLHLESCSVSDELSDMLSAKGLPSRNFSRGQSGTYEVIDGALQLEFGTEFVYQLPHNTTLVEVLGPVGQNFFWGNYTECYALLNPRPSWWIHSNFPVSKARGIVNATDQTMFLLPIDPEVPFELRIGHLGDDRTCQVSAIRTYPFHYDFSAGRADSNSSAVDSSSSGSKKSKTVPTIVGIVVGVVGGLILLGLAAWLLRRDRKRREEREKAFLPDPYSTEPVEPRTKAELVRMTGSEEPRRAADDAASEEETATEPRRRRGPRIVQEEDGESVVEYLPPQYREAWQTGAERGSPRPPARGDAEDEVQQDGGASSVPIRNSMSEEKATKLDPSDRPPLKQEYAQTFSRALPQPPSTSLSFGQPQPGSNASESNLKNEYKRRFGSSAQSSEGQDALLLSHSELERMSEKAARPGPVDSAEEGGPRQQLEGLRDQYKRRFG